MRKERDPVRALERVLEAARSYASLVPSGKAAVPFRERLQAAIADYDELFSPPPDHFEATGEVGEAGNIIADARAALGGAAEGAGT